MSAEGTNAPDRAPDTRRRRWTMHSRAKKPMDPNPDGLTRIGKGYAPALAWVDELAVQANATLAAAGAVRPTGATEPLNPYQDASGPYAQHRKA